MNPSPGPAGAASQAPQTPSAPPVTAAPAKPASDGLAFSSPGSGPACRNCGTALQVLNLAGHYGRSVEIDLCPGCHLVWFDVVESARLASPGLLDLIGAMAKAQRLPHQPLRPDLRCLHCSATVRRVHNRTRWGRSQQLECPQRHGAWQTFGEFLNEKGLLRPMSSADRHRALARDGVIHCINCGGDIGATDSECSWCGSVPAVVDVARLARALDPEGATAEHSVHRTEAAKTALACAACGAAQPADLAWQCQTCGATLTAPDLAEAHARVSEIAPALLAHAARPSPEIVRRRLAEQSGGLERQRERAAQMQAEAEARMRGTIVRTPDPIGGQAPTWLWWVVAAAGLLALLWRWWVG
jgi:Zn-finger nucleic acid-binding protein